jgi:AbrB family looped-hinge helix DNA binding protein
MGITIDRAGRVVIPKAFRDELGLAEGAELTITSDGVGLRLEPVAEGGRLVAVNGVIAVESASGRVVSDDELRKAMDASRR